MTTYDQLPYPGSAYECTHPDVLATAATLAGLSPAPVERCRVLELGCAAGKNILPLALAWPESSFVGVDLAQTHIDEGRQISAALGIQNTELRQADILDLDDSLGQFDYIIVHGVFSWVPAQVQTKILDLCRTCLAPHGMAVISYNVYPGWHALDALRHGMRYRAGSETDPGARVAAAEAHVQMLERANAGGIEPVSFFAAHKALVSDYAEHLRQKHDVVLIHDELAPLNQPFYFHQFVDLAGHHGLQYLGNGEYATTSPYVLASSLREQVMALADNRLEQEQYLDFIRNRSFRYTLLCQESCRLQPQPTWDTLRNLLFSSRATIDPGNGEAASVRSGDGAFFNVAHPLTVEAFRHLSRIWPRACSLDNLLHELPEFVLVEADQAEEGQPDLQRASDIFGAEPGADTPDVVRLAANLFHAAQLSAGLAEIHTWQPGFADQADERPAADPWARWQAGQGLHVTNLRHRPAELDEVSRFLLQRLDGNTDVAALAKALSATDLLAEQQGLSAEQVQGIVRGQLRWLASAGLLLQA